MSLVMDMVQAFSALVVSRMLIGMRMERQRHQQRQICSHQNIGRYVAYRSHRHHNAFVQQLL